MWSLPIYNTFWRSSAPDWTLSEKKMGCIWCLWYMWRGYIIDWCGAVLQSLALVYVSTGSSLLIPFILTRNFYSRGCQIAASDLRGMGGAWESAFPAVSHAVGMLGRPWIEMSKPWRRASSVPENLYTCRFPGPAKQPRQRPCLLYLKQGCERLSRSCYHEEEGRTRREFRI